MPMVNAIRAQPRVQIAHEIYFASARRRLMLVAVSPLSLTNLLARAPRHLPDYLARTHDLSHVMKGIRRSEMFFLYANIIEAAPARILESGRARAQSTLVLSLLFPEARIVSIESDAASPDVAIAAERLRERGNVECLFGDSRQLLPELLRAGDVVLIDGPKDFRGVKLALRLLRSGKPLALFVHDLWLGSPARNFVDRHVPAAFLSDAPAWVENFSNLDSNNPPTVRLLPNERLVYGATLGCFPPMRGNYATRLALCAFAQMGERLRETARKIRGRPSRARLKDFSVVAR